VSRSALLDHVVRGLKPAPSDPDLLAAFVERRDAEAFRRIVDRYSPMIGGICRRLLHDEHAANDAVQTTFLALARRPVSVRGDALAGWLCSVARRTCHKSCRTDRRRAARETAVARPDIARPIDDLSVRELLGVLDEEVARLPAESRSALLVCYWQGETQAEAARRLGKTAAAVKGLLERGRAKMLARLARRGLTGDVALRALLIAPAGLAILPASLFAELSSATLRPFSAVPKFGMAAGGIAMTSAIAGVGLWLAMLPAQSPPTSMPKAPPALPVVASVDALGDPLPDGALLRLGTQRFRHPDNAFELALSPNEKVVVSAGADLIIGWEATSGQQLWQVNVGKEGIRLPGSSYGCRAIAFAPDGRLITPGRGCEIALRDAMTGKDTLLKIQRPRNTGRVIKSIDVAPDGRSLAVGSELGISVCNFDGKIRYEIANDARGQVQVGDDRLMFGGHFGYAIFAPRGNTLAVVTSDAPEVVRLHDAATGAERRRIQLAAKLVRMAFSPDGQSLFATERDQSVRAYSIGNGKRLWEHQVKLNNLYENYTSTIAVRPDGKTVAVGATDHIIYLLDAATGDETGRLKGHGWYPWATAFTSDGATLFSSGWDGPIRRWDVTARKQMPLPKGVRGSALATASPDGKTLAYVDDSDIIHVVDASTGVDQRTLHIAGASYSQLLFSLDGKRLATGGSSGDSVHVAIWEVPTGEVVRRWDWPKGRDPHCTVESLSFTPDGSRLAAATFRQSSARIWDVNANQEIAQLPHPEIYGLSFSPDGKTLATAGWDKRVRFWNPDTKKVLREFEVTDTKNQGADTRLYAVCYSPTGELFATADMAACVHIWNVSDLSLRTTLKHDSGFMFGAVSFSPDGLFVATGVREGTVQVWDPRSGEKVWDRGKHTGHVYNVGFGRDSRTLISGANDGVGYYWDLRPKQKPTTDAVALWTALGTEGPAAYQALWELADSPKETLALFRGKFRPEPAADPAIVRKLITDLDSDKFAVRSAAQTELAQLGSRANAQLREALAKGGSTEQRERLTKLLDDLASANRPTEMRNRRAVTVLTWIGTPEARRLLETWSMDDPDGSLGTSAKFALKRWR
jgi:RNA polymerase sigma factor (sigma-70 family)